VLARKLPEALFSDANRENTGLEMVDICTKMLADELKQIIQAYLNEDQYNLLLRSILGNYPV